jgi:GNAT superfamily N-acetyltransferase
MEEQLKQQENTEIDISVRPMEVADLSVAEHIFRMAFGTFLGLPDPAAFAGDMSYVKTRWTANPGASFVAEVESEVVGSNLATNWGSVGFFGPLSIRPDLWDKGVGKRLMEPIMGLFDKWGTKHAGLFTFAHSPKHIALYQKFGFYPRFLTAIMSKAVDPIKHAAHWTTFSEASTDEQQEISLACRELTDAIYEGLNVELEIRSVLNQALGDTVLLWDGSHLAGFAVCHTGVGTEAGTGACYIKFAAVRPGQTAEQHFNRLLDACEEMAASEGLSRLVAGVNTARHQAYRQLLAHGFRTDFQGVAMQKPNEAGYNRPDVYIIDDWR